MRERFLTGYNNFVLPFLIGMVFILTYCLVCLFRILHQLPHEDRKRFLLSLVNPKILLKNIRDIFCDCLLHLKIWKRNKLLGYMHSSIAFGWFMLIVIGHIEVFLYVPHRAKFLYYPIFFRYFVAETESTLRGGFFFFLMDFFLLVVLSGIFLAMLKRLRSRMFGMRRTTNQSLLDTIGLYSLWSIFPLRLLAEGFTAEISGGSFLTKSLNHVFTAFLGNHVNMLPTWWAYSIALGVFFCVLPFTRYMHIPSEMLLIPLRNAGLKIRNARKGLAKVQVYSCPSCGLCIDACPMSVMKTHAKDTTVYLNRQIRRGNEKRIEEISDKCLLCGKCTAICPVGVQGDALRVAQRALRNSGMESVWKTSGKIAGTPEPPQSKGKILYFAGCMTALTPAIMKSIGRLLKASGNEYEILDRDGGICCGRPMMTAGRTEEAEGMIRRNTELILGSGADTLLVSCPICYRVFTENYNLPGVRVVHHSVWLKEMLDSGVLEITPDNKRYVWHDPCELGRGCGIYEQPREVLKAAGELVEAGMHHKESLCCGGSLGSLTLNFEKRRAMTQNALENITAENPDVIVTGCPLCLNTFGRFADRPVKDISEVAAALLKSDCK